MANLNSLSPVERDNYVRAKAHFERGEVDPALDSFSKLLAVKVKQHNARIVAACHWQRPCLDMLRTGGTY